MAEEGEVAADGGAAADGPTFAEASEDAASAAVVEDSSNSAPAEPSKEDMEKMEEDVNAAAPAAAAGEAEEAVEAAAGGEEKAESASRELGEEAAAAAKQEQGAEEELLPPPEIRIVADEGSEEREQQGVEEAGAVEGSVAAAPGAEGEEPSVPPEVVASMSLLTVLPTSETFTEGEPPEPPPLQVGADLGRRISLSLRELEDKRLSSDSLEFSGSSDEMEQEAETAEEREQRLAEEQRERAELVEQYRQLMAERSRLRHHNSKLQGKLGDLLNKTKGKERAQAAELEQHISDKEQRYTRYLAMLEELRTQQQEEMTWSQQQIEAVQRSCNEKLAKVESQWKAYLAAKKEVAVYTIGRRLGGRQAAIQEVDRIQAREQAKEKEMIEVRLENIKLRHRIQRLDVSLKAQEELAEGLHLIDFEQLKIENQTYSEKIEERNEELQKLRRKINNTVQILTQIKEKLQFVEGKNHGQKAQLITVESFVAQERDVLTKTKQARDKLRMDNQKLQQKCGLLGNALLLKDFEDKVDATETLNERLDALKYHHAGLSLTCKGLKKKLRGVKSFLPV